MLDFVKEKAINSIDSGADLDRWDEPDNQKNYQKRKEVLQKTKEILLSPMPPTKKVPLPEWLRPEPWKVGDVLVYKVMCF